MEDHQRLTIAFAIIAAVVVIGAVWGVTYMRRRKREKLRRRGIKTYGH